MRLGDRADAQIERLAEQLGLTQADVLRLALRRLETDRAAIRDVEAHTAARGMLDALMIEHGDLANLKIEIRPGASDADVIVMPRGFADERQTNLQATIRREDGRVTVDLYDPEADVTVYDVRAGTDDPAGVTMTVLLKAVHLQTPVPPIGDETVVAGPDGKEMTVYQPDGTALRYLLRGDKPGLLPHRRAAFGPPNRNQRRNHR